MKKARKMFLVLISLVCLLNVTVTPTFAADSYYHSGTGSETFSVTTKAAWYYPGKESITFRNYKVEYKSVRYSWLGFRRIEEIKKAYPQWTIRVVSTDGKHKFTTTMKGSSKKVKLKRNKTYRITVSYHPFNGITTGSLIDQPEWSVKGLWKATIN